MQFGLVVLLGQVLTLMITKKITAQSTTCVCEKGERGFDGIPGLNGLPGHPGLNGFKGQKGETGEPGTCSAYDCDNRIRGNDETTTYTTYKRQTNGLPGPIGKTGPRGPAGLQGFPGLNGQKGETGKPGICSAYDCDNRIRENDETTTHTTYKTQTNGQDYSPYIYAVLVIGIVLLATDVFLIIVIIYLRKVWNQYTIDQQYETLRHGQQRKESTKVYDGLYTYAEVKGTEHGPNQGFK